MTNLTTKLNKLVLDDSPSEKLINACAEIDIESCFDLIFEPPIDFLEECRKRWENLMNPFTGTVERKIGNTWYLLETVWNTADTSKRLVTLPLLANSLLTSG